MREVTRGNRALRQHTFVLLPRVFTAERLQRCHIDLYRENDRAIGRLATLVTHAANTFTGVGTYRADARFSRYGTAIVQVDEVP